MSGNPGPSNASTLLYCPCSKCSQLDPTQKQAVSRQTLRRHTGLSPAELGALSPDEISRRLAAHTVAQGGAGQKRPFDADLRVSEAMAESGQLKRPRSTESTVERVIDLNPTATVRRILTPSIDMILPYE